YGAVAHDDHGAAGPDLRGHRSVPPGGHHVGEREQGGQQLLGRLLRGGDERAVGLGDADVLSLAAVDEVSVAVRATEATTVGAGGLHSCLAVRAGVVGPEERGDDEVARTHGVHGAPDLLDHADELMADAARLAHRGAAAVGPQVGAAYARRDRP